MSDYAQDARDADASFREDGQLIAIEFKQPGAYAGGAVTPGISVFASAWGIETSVTAHDLGVTTVGGTLVQAGDRKILLSALADDGTALPTPKVDDLMTAGGQIYSIKAVDKVSPGGIVVMWSLVGRI